MISISAQFHNDFSSGKLELVRAATASGYLSKKNGFRISSYDGRYGLGYTVEYPNVLGFTSHNEFVKSNNFHKIEYYIFK